MVHLEPAWSAVRETMRHRAAVRAVDRAVLRHLRECGLKLPEFLLLASLADELNASARPADIARKIGLTSGGVTKLVDRCVLRGLVRRSREPDDGDKRTRPVWMTLYGQQRLEAATPRFAELTAAAIGGVS